MQWILMLWMWLFGSPDAAQMAHQSPPDVSRSPQELSPQSVQIGSNSSGKMIVRDIRYVRKHTVVIFEDTHFTKVPQ